VLIDHQRGIVRRRRGVRGEKIGVGDKASARPLPVECGGKKRNGAHFQEGGVEIRESFPLGDSLLWSEIGGPSSGTKDEWILSSSVSPLNRGLKKIRRSDRKESEMEKKREKGSKGSYKKLKSNARGGGPNPQ